MAKSSDKYGVRGGNGWLLLLVTAFLASLMVFILKNDSSSEESDKNQELLVYCAAGVKRAVEEVAGKFEQELGVKIALEYASSGVLANKLKTDRESGIARADVYIPADYIYTERAAADVMEVIVVFKDASDAAWFVDGRDGASWSRITAQIGRR